MIYIGIGCIVLAAVVFIYEKTSNVEVIQKIDGKINVRTVRKFIWLKTLDNYKYVPVTVFMQTRNVVQIQKTNSEEWVDVSWAAGQ